MSKLIILLNGFPSSGKDTTAKYLSARHGFTHLKFATPLIESFCKAYKIDIPSEQDYNLNKDLEGMFDIPFRTLREGLIYFAEEVIKPVFGKNIFSKAVSEKILRTYATIGDNIVFSDLGFEYELQSIENMLFGDDIVVVEVQREGFQRGNDSRELVGAEFTIQNSGDERLFDNIEESLIKIKDWISLSA